MEQEQVLDPQRLQQQDHIGQVGSLDLWDGGGQHLILIGTLSVKPLWRRNQINFTTVEDIVLLRINLRHHHYTRATEFKLDLTQRQIHKSIIY